MKIGVRPAARRDIILQVGYYLEQRAYDAAERFPPAVQEAFARIQEQPGIGTPCSFNHLSWLTSAPGPFRASRKSVSTMSSPRRT
jgi:plasmid stabilization system protein ParE